MLAHQDSVPVPGTSPTTSPRTVVDFLKENRPLDEIREHVRRCIAPSARDLIASTDKDGNPCNPLNEWLQGQKPLSFAEKYQIAQFVNQLLEICGLGACYKTEKEGNGVSFYLNVTKADGYEAGRILATPFGGRKPIFTRREFADFPDFELVVREKKQETGPSPLATSWVVSIAQATDASTAAPKRRT